jgi:hypothetical protein
MFPKTKINNNNNTFLLISCCILINLFSKLITFECKSSFSLAVSSKRVFAVSNSFKIKTEINKKNQQIQQKLTVSSFVTRSLDVFCSLTNSSLA